MLTSMGRMVQIKDVPDDVHRILKARAAMAGLTLTEYARRSLEEAARRPSRDELVVDLLVPPDVARREFLVAQLP